MIQVGSACGGALTGSDETLENAYLMRMAGRFSRRIRGYAKAHDIPVIDCSAGQRKHELAEEYLAKTKIAQGLFLVLVGRHKRRCGISVPSTTSNETSRCPMSTTIRFTSLTGLGPSDDQDQWASTLSRPSDLERPRVCCLPGAPGWHHIHQGRKLFYCHL